MIIGLYDSGLGGLSVWRELRHLNARFIYFGDTAHVPYGEKTPAQLQDYFWQILDFLQGKGCQGVVIACNTASALVLPAVKPVVSMPVIGIIEAAVQGCLQVGQGRLGVLATQATVDSEVYQQAFREARPNWQVFVHGAPQLASLVEQGQATESATKRVVAEYLEPLIAQNIDTLLLGCTHYPFLRPLVEEVVGSSVQIVDPAPILAEQVSCWLDILDSRQDRQGPSTEFWVSAHPERFQMVAQSLLQEEIPPVGVYKLSGANHL